MVKVKNKVLIKGVGLHSGLESVMTVIPKKSGGIVFVRNGKKIPALYSNVSDTMLRNTTIGAGKSRVKTIEHIMAALFASGIFNAEIKIDNPEVPIMDGSAREFMRALKSIKPVGRAPIIRIKKEIIAKNSEIKLPLFVRAFNLVKGNKKHDGFVKLSPGKKNLLEITAELDLPKVPVIGRQKCAFIFDYNNFEKSAKKFMAEIAMTRTFGGEAELAWLKKHNMGRGVNGTNVIAINAAGDDTLNDMFYKSAKARREIMEKYGHLLPPGGKIVKRHFPDEFVRHKILDAVGDLYTAGARIAGKFESSKGGHALNNLVLRKLFADPSNYEIIE